MGVVKVILDVVFSWVAVGFASFVMFTAMEFIALSVRPDYKNILKEHKTEDDKKPPKSPTTFFLFWMLTWPLMAYKVIHALFRNQTLLEYMLAEENEIRERKEKAKVHAVKTIVTSKEVSEKAATRWIIREAGDGKVFVLLRDFPEGETPTHVLVVPDDKAVSILAARATESPRLVLPMRLWPNTFETLPEAMRKCEADAEWSVLCVPAMRPVRDRVLHDLRKDLMKVGR